MAQILKQQFEENRQHITIAHVTPPCTSTPIDTMATEPVENDNMLGVLIVLFLVVVSTIYVFAQQQQQQQQQGQNGHRGGLPVGANVAGQQPVNVVSTAGLTEHQLRLHRALPSRHGARTITICADALLANKTDAQGGIAWKSDETPRVLADLLLVADVCVLCKMDGDVDQPTRDRIQRFLTTPSDPAATPKCALKSHKILFCSTSIGKIAFVRQIEPQVHVEVDLSVVRDLEKHVPRIVRVVSTLNATPEPGMHHVTDNFATYFELLGAM